MSLVNLQFSDDVCARAGFRTVCRLHGDARTVTGRQGARKPILAEMFDVLAGEARATGCRYFGFANSDIHISQEAVDLVRAGGYQAYVFSRMDFDGANGQDKGIEDTGQDLFVIEACWWRDNRWRFRPYIVAERVWDNVYTAILLCHAEAILLNRFPYIRHEVHPTSAQGMGPFADYTKMLASLDSPYFSLWVRYWRQLKNAPMITGADVLRLQVEIFRWRPSWPERLLQTGRSIKARFSYWCRASLPITPFLKRLRNRLGDFLGQKLSGMPRLEPITIAAARSACAMPLFEALWRRTSGVMADELAREEIPYRRLRLGAVEMVFDVSDHAARRTYFSRTPYEPQTTRYLLSRLARGETFVDIGANHGYFTVLAALRVGAMGKVFAFEPHPGALKRLQDHLAVNAVSARVQAADFAFSDADADAVDFFVGDAPNTHAYSSLVPSRFALDQGWLSLGHKVSIRTKTFDRWFNASGLRHIDMIKIDVEGAEEKVLGGMRETLAHRPPARIICETSWNGPAHRLLSENGYQARPLDCSDAGYGNILFFHR